MWRMIKAAITGVLIGIVGGVLVAQIGVALEYKDKITKSKAQTALSINPSNDAKKYNTEDNVIRLKVNYQGGELLNEEEQSQLDQVVKQSVLYLLSYELGEDYSKQLSRTQVMNKIKEYMSDIERDASEAAIELGYMVEAKGNLGYKWLEKQVTTDGNVYSQGYYMTLEICLMDPV